MRWVGVIGLGIVAAVLVLFVWQPGGGGEAGGPLNAIAEAAERTQQEPGERAVMRAVFSSPTTPEPVTMTGRMVSDAEGRTQGVITAPDPKSGGSMKLEMIAEPDALYIHSKKLGVLPGGRKWMGLDLAQLSSEQELDSPLPSDMDAKGELEVLANASGKVQKLGVEKVRGVRTTRYRIAGDKDGPRMRLEAWIDADKLVRRMRILHLPSAGQDADPARIDMRVDFFDFGIEPQIEAPDSSEVFDATELAGSGE